MKQKFEPKVLLWIAGSEKGFSQAYLAPSGIAIDKTVYTKECINKRLTKFIKKYHADNKYLFWLDKTSAHYSKMSIQSLKDKKYLL